MEDYSLAQLYIIERIEKKNEEQENFQFYSDSYDDHSDYSDDGYSDS